MGGVRVTVKNLEVLRIDEEHNLMVVRGAVPGARGSYLTVRRHAGGVAKIAAPTKTEGKKKG